MAVGLVRERSVFTGWRPPGVGHRRRVGSAARRGRRLAGGEPARLDDLDLLPAWLGIDEMDEAADDRVPWAAMATSLAVQPAEAAAHAGQELGLAVAVVADERRLQQGDEQLSHHGTHDAGRCHVRHVVGAPGPERTVAGLRVVDLLVAVGGADVRPAAHTGRGGRGEGGVEHPPRRGPTGEQGVLRAAPRRPAGAGRAVRDRRGSGRAAPAGGRGRCGHRGVTGSGARSARHRSRRGGGGAAGCGLALDHRLRPLWPVVPPGGLRRRRPRRRAGSSVGTPIAARPSSGTQWPTPWPAWWRRRWWPAPCVGAAASSSTWPSATWPTPPPSRPTWSFAGERADGGAARRGGRSRRRRPDRRDARRRRRARPGRAPRHRRDRSGPEVFTTTDLAVFYGAFRAVRDVTLRIKKNEITAFIGPSGCGKSTVLRCFNRMNDLIDGARVDGKVRYHGIDLYDPTSAPSRCGDGSAWCSRNRTRFRRASTTTSRSDRGSRA